jgi:23S rRNA pseudouridine955/2504/2580 synthase
MREIVLSSSEAPRTLEKFLLRKFPIGYVRKVFRKDGARINGRRAKDTDLVRGGDRVQLYIPFEPAGNGSATARIGTLFEDESLLVIDKPAGIAAHEGKTVAKAQSLLGILESRYRKAGLTPRLIHRLDRDTSGVMMIAKNEETYKRLIDAFESGDVVKEYVCLLAGRLAANEGRIDLPLPGREGHPVSALTRYRVLKRFSDTTLARAAIETGRLHQIRLHFAKLGFPVVLDEQHGDFPFNKRFRREYGLKRQFLHAERLKIAYDGKLREWRAPLPDELQQVVRKLEQRYGG